MPKHNRSQKKAAKRRMDNTGMRRAAAAGGTGHHHKGPDLTMLKTIPHAAGRPVNTRLAAALVAACRAGCQPCQASAIPKLAADRPTVAALAGAAFDNPLTRLASGPGTFTSEPIRAWWAAARGAGSDPDCQEHARAGLDLLEKMTEAQVTELLNDVLDHWAAGAEPDDEQSAPGIQLVTLEDLGIDPADPEPAGGTYGVTLTQIVLPGQPPLPMLTLYPQSAAAGLEDLRRRTGWKAWDESRLPAMDISWRARLDIATRSLEELVRVDAEGWDEEVLWQAAERVCLPDNWWDLIDRTEHILVAGPGAPDDGSLDAGAIATIARARFM
ncbi:hypothetical protein [Kitasatospora sp. NPDC087315]|uniref:hypothetical protein n=1 Tax=Kitasatospora sp. NPDC087315 TaxID=3364069 RepID=UPI003808606C